MKRIIEFYVIHADQRWTPEPVILEGEDANLPQDEAVALAKKRLEDAVSEAGTGSIVGPVYHIGNVEQDETKFYKTTIVIEVLSDDGPYDPETVQQIHFDILSGDYVGSWEVKESKPLSSKGMADTLLAFGSEPGFFMLNDDGSDQSEMGKAPESL